jgi:uncharacterized repeat protein (TIGR03806 family)
MTFNRLIPLLFLVSPLALAVPFHPEGIRIPLAAPVASGARIARAFPRLRFEKPVQVLSTPALADRIFVVEQKGRIRYFPNVADACPATAVDGSCVGKLLIDLTDRVAFGGEMGLLSMAFPPDFASSRELYVAYTAEEPRRLEIARLRMPTNDRAELTDSPVIITIPKSNPDVSNHNGGQIAFGPDGYLYIGTGDGGGAGDVDNNAQNPQQLLGKILRIDVRGQRSYRVPSDNPFVGRSGVRPEIWTLGMRNPWRFAFDAVTGALWEADVGQNAWEEINVLKKGRNYGWRIFEGLHDFKNPNGLQQTCSDPSSLRCFDKPIFEYRQGEDGRSITGGLVYRGTRAPSLVGKYIYGDYVSGRVWALSSDGATASGTQAVGDVSPLTQALVAFGADAQGEVYVVSHNGTLARIEGGSSESTPTLPQRLSDTGIFERDLSTLRAVAGLEEYKVNASLWSDGASKRRWMGLPAGGRVGFRARGAWDYPAGTIFVKHFELTTSSGATKRLETRVLFNHREGWRGYTYRWDADGRDARLINARETEDISVRSASTSLGAVARRTQTWTYPSRADCLSCHTASAGFVLGAVAPQLNGPGPDGRNQISAWAAASVFSSDPGNPSALDAYTDMNDARAPLEHRVRSYLAVNCAQCHNAQSGTPGNMDMRFEVPLASMRLINVDPTQGNLGIIGAKRIKPGERRMSVLWKRMDNLDTATRMPPLGSSVKDEKAVDEIAQWIRSMD